MGHPRIIGPARVEGVDRHPDDLREFEWLNERHRYYRLEPLGEGENAAKGAYGTVYKACACDENQNARSEVNLIVKIPNVYDDTEEHEIRERLARIREKNDQEYNHIRARLRGCPHANPIIDILNWHDGTYELPVTVQPFISDGLDLDAWLHKEGLRDKKAKREKLPAGGARVDRSNWSGIQSRPRWLDLCLAIAHAIEAVHLRRVSHADLHPGNIFIKSQRSTHAVLIDFGDAFLSMPSRKYRFRNPNPYLAPERLGPRFPFNEQVDVYSFGILMLYLATGVEQQFVFEGPVGKQRSTIHDLIRLHNPQLLGGDPRILDVIGRSIARDPADRPRMSDLREDLEYLIDAPEAKSVPSVPRIGETLERIADKVRNANGQHNPILIAMIERELREFEAIFDGLSTDMVEVNGTRDHTLRVVNSLVDHLRPGDSWSSVTTLPAWQRSALGLNGSFSSANIRAVQRGVAVRRVFVVSVEELGVDFCKQMALFLAKSDKPQLRALGERVDVAVSLCGLPSTPRHPFEDWHRQRFTFVVDYLNRFVEDWQLRRCVNASDRVDIRTSTGLWLGLCPVPTLEEVGIVREANPATLMHLAHEHDPMRRWLLVTAETRGRADARGALERPQLTGVRVYTSVQSKRRLDALPTDGEPKDRIAAMQKVMAPMASDHFNALRQDVANSGSMNIGNVTAELLDVVRRARDAVLVTA